MVYTQAGQTPQTVSWSWDLTGSDYSNSIGRLSRTDHPSGASRFRYDPRGRITEAVQAVYATPGANSAAVVTSTKYGYTFGDLTSITYHSGRQLTILRDRGEIIGISLAKDAGSTAAPLISNVTWEPFGPISGWDWHMASGLVSHQRSYDLSGRMVRYPIGGVLRDVTYDAADRIVGFTHLLASNGTVQPALDQSFGYDENSRLTSIVTSSASWAIGYDANGNRTSVSLNGSPSTYTTEATSNRLTSISNPARSFGYDNAGNTTSDSAGYTATYGLNGSVASITKAGITGTYSYDASQRRIRKFTSAGAGSTVVFAYDLEGQLLGEYDQNGQAIREYVWLENIPVAMFMPDPANPSGQPLVYYIHADHLNAPRIVVDQNNATRWRWLAEPFGTTAPETNPDGLGAFTQNLRFPGQYADTESGLWYNYFRNYDSGTGRYRESDPIGLNGGINTYGYAFASPAQHIDSDGRFVLNAASGFIGAVTGGVTGYFATRASTPDATWRDYAAAIGVGALAGGAAGVVTPAGWIGAILAGSVGAAAGDVAGQAVGKAVRCESLSYSSWNARQTMAQGMLGGFGAAGGSVATFGLRGLAVARTSNLISSSVGGAVPFASNTMLASAYGGFVLNAYALPSESQCTCQQFLP